jgi:hypothetical protein
MSRRPGLSFEAMTVGLLFVVVAFGACLTVAQADTFWNLRAGQDIWRTGHVPNVDAYSYTAAGRAWPDHEWLWQAVAYPLFRLGGFPLLTAAAATSIVGAVALVYRLTVGAVSTRFLLLALAIPLASLVWTLRPQLATLLGLAVLLTLLVRDRTRWIPLLFLAWANAHAGVALGGAVLSGAVVTAWLRARRADASDVDRARPRRLALALAASAAATTLTPLGPGIFRFVLTSEARLRAAHISEWMPFALGRGVAIAFVVLAVGFVALFARRARLLCAAAWGDWVCVAAALVLLPLALRSARHVGPWLLLAPAAASRLLGADFRLRRRPAPPSGDHPVLNALVLALVAGAAAASIAVLWMLPLPRLGWRPVPAGALAAVRACPDGLYNHYNDGGYLIWLLPERRVFVDSRQDPFELPFLLEHVRVESGQASALPVLERWGARCAFLPIESPTVATLAGAGWRTTYRDERWSVQVAPGR